MESLDILKGKRVYFDANIFIYLIEGNTKYDHIIEELRDLILHEAFSVHSCDMVISEILPPMVKNDDQKAIKGTIDLLCNSGAVFLGSVSREICIQAGFLRGKHGMSTPDALHVASAIEQECDVFLTNDKGIRVPGGMERILILDL